MTWWLIGLGNPGVRYAQTRHNAGWRVATRVAEAAGVSWTSSWFRPFSWATIERGEDTLMLLRAKSWMNQSAASFEGLWRRGGLDPARLLVVFDQMDLPAGVLRFKRSGSAGGHNGLKSLDTLWEGAYARLAVGVGRPGAEGVVDHVLGEASGDDALALERAEAQAAAVLLAHMTRGWEATAHEIQALARAASKAPTTP